MTTIFARFFRVSVLAAGLLLVSFAARAEAPSGCFGKLRSIAGKVEIQKAKAPSWEQAGMDTCMFEDYGLRTGPRSGALVTLDDQSEIRLNENTTVFFTSVTRRFLLTRLTGMSLRAGEIYMDITEGYYDIFVQSDSAAVMISGANADIMLVPEDEGDLESPTGTSVFVSGGAVYVFDVFLKYRVTVGPGQQTNVARHKPPQAVYFYNQKPLEKYLKLWRSNLMPGRKTDELYAGDVLAEFREDTLACPADNYKSALWCCPNVCSKGPSDLPQDIYCPDGTYYVGARKCCDNECLRK